MFQPITRLAAVLLALLGIAGAGIAAVDHPLRFELRSSNPNEAKLKVDRGDGNDRQGSFTSSYAIRDLQGLSASPFLGLAPAAVHFSLTAPAGRIDCAGTGSRGSARGNCDFKNSPAFASVLQRHGYPAPNFDDGLTLTALRFDPEVLDALDRAGFRHGSVSNLPALAIFHIDGRHVRAMVQAGYRPEGPSELVQLKVLDISPDFIVRFAAAGYRDLPADQLVQLKLFNITPDFVRIAEKKAGRRLATNELVERRIFARDR